MDILSSPQPATITATDSKTTRSADVIACSAAVILGAAYVALFVWRQWLPWDDGTIAQAAERTFHGQLPHRDFNEPYTGGLTFLHVAAFRLFGVSIWALRTTLLAFAVATIPAWYYIARRFGPPLFATAAAVTCVTWSVPNYPAPLPSWYNLFFATAAIACVLRYLDKGTLRWLFFAGVAVGLSILAKITGVYLGAAVVVFLSYDSAFDRAEEPTSRNSRAIAVTLLLITFVLAAFPLLLTASGNDKSSLNSVLSLGVPPAFVAGAASLAFAERLATGRLTDARVVRALLVLCSGAAAVLIVFAIPYFVSHATSALLTGVFLRAQFRLHVRSAAAPGPELAWTALSLPLVYACLRGRQVASTFSAIALVAFWVAANIAASTRLPGLFVWLSIRMLMLPLALVASWYMWRAAKNADGAGIRFRQFVLISTVAAWCGLVQFPFTHPTYFAYVAPLVLLALVALAEWRARPAPILRAITLAGYCAFAIVMRPRIHPGQRRGEPPTALLPTPRGGISVSAEDATTYRELVTVLNSHARSKYTLASPDLPEVYFLSGLANPTRSFFEIFDVPPTKPGDVLAMIDSHGITAIVINHRPQFSEPMSAGLADSLVRRFPEAQSIGSLEVRWSR